AGAACAGQRRRPARRGRRARPMTSAKAFDSFRCPGVTVRARRMPMLQQTRWTLVPKPPCERPSAWSGGSAVCDDSGPASRTGLAGFFFRPPSGAAGADDGGIDAPQVAVDEPPLVQAEQQGVEDLGPGAVLAPAVEAVVDGLPGP